LIANRHASLDWTQRPQEAIYCGAPPHAENFPLLFNDAAAAYALALRWKVSCDDAYAGKAIDILNARSASLEMIDGSSDKFLASGIYGYELANATEILLTVYQTCGQRRRERWLHEANAFWGSVTEVSQRTQESATPVNTSFICPAGFWLSCSQPNSNVGTSVHFVLGSILPGGGS